MFNMLNAEPVGYKSVYVIQHREKCTQLVAKTLLSAIWKKGVLIGDIS